MTTDLEPRPMSLGGVALIVLAAGQGTRMRSAIPKPLHPIAGMPMLRHVLLAGGALAPKTTILVVNSHTPDLAERAGFPGLTTVVQDPPRGTGDATRLALKAAGDARWGVVLFADHPLLTAEIVTELLRGAVERRARVAVLTCTLPDAGGYGRIARDDRGRVRRIIERADDDPDSRTGSIEINSGMMAIDLAWAGQALERLRPSQASGELYLTDLVELAVGDASNEEAWPVTTVEADPEVALGVNDRAQLAAADAIARDRVRRALFAAGVSLIGVETIFVDAGVRIGPDTVLLPGTQLTGATTIGERCTIGPQTTIADSRIGDDVAIRLSAVNASIVESGSDIGPYAHLRPGTIVGPNVHIGNFVELKNSRLAAGVAVGHVTYLGDTTVGERANIGAGTITANYDGRDKHPTTIGRDAFIGVDTMLVAPVTVGDEAKTGAGSVVTKDVPAGMTVVGVPARAIRRRQLGGPTGGGEG